MNTLEVLGKGCYIWQGKKMLNGNANEVVRMLQEAKVDHVCIKIADGAVTWKGLEFLFKAIQDAGIVAGAWVFAYFNNAIGEFNAIRNAVLLYSPAYLLIDFEGQSKLKYIAANLMMSLLRKAFLNLPIGSNSFWKPSYHPMVPFYQVRKYCDFDSPQIYSRGYRVVEKYFESKNEYKKMIPKLPFDLPAGDMYFEHGIKPSGGDVINFINTAFLDGAKGVIMWSMDQCETTPDLWSAFSSFEWKTGSTGDKPYPVIIGDQPLYAGVVTASSLNVRSQPLVSKPSSKNVVDGLIKGERVDVWEQNSEWLKISKDKELWVSRKWIKVL